MTPLEGFSLGAIIGLGFAVVYVFVILPIQDWIDESPRFREACSLVVIIPIGVVWLCWLVLSNPAAFWGLVTQRKRPE